MVLPKGSLRSMSYLLEKIFPFLKRMVSREPKNPAPPTIATSLLSINLFQPGVQCVSLLIAVSEDCIPSTQSDASIPQLVLSLFKFG